MLTIYQQIQEAVDLVEADLARQVTAEQAARRAGMSLRNLHRYFPALTGYRFGEYARRRRLAAAVDELRSGEDSILTVAVDSGYDSHEAFTRAFRSEFGVNPSEFRTDPVAVNRVGPIDLVGEINMGVLTKDLPEMTAVVFDGFRPDPEETAIGKMTTWMDGHPEVIGSHRVFGHNIDPDGNIAHDPDNVGYRIYVTVPESALPFEDESRVETIAAGTFVVTGIEGSFEEDPTGAWVTEGWQRLNQMVKRNKLELHPSHRWFEEVLDPVKPGNTRFDLYAELA